jgi:hypothetical protein
LAVFFDIEGVCINRLFVTVLSVVVTTAAFALGPKKSQNINTNLSKTDGSSIDKALAAATVSPIEPMKINCDLVSDEAQGQCKSLIADKLAALGCDVSAVECRRDTSNGRFKCFAVSSNCESVKSDGFSGTSCERGINEAINFGKKKRQTGPWNHSRVVKTSSSGSLRFSHRSRRRQSGETSFQIARQNINGIVATAPSMSSKCLLALRHLSLACLLVFHILIESS